MSQEKRYVEAETLANIIDGIHISYPTSYSSGQLENMIHQLIGQAVNVALLQFKTQLSRAIRSSSIPYDKCLLCVQRDDCKPPNLGV